MRLLVLTLIILLPSCLRLDDLRLSAHKTLLQTAEIKSEAATPPEIPETGPIRITVEEVVLTALENNRSLAVERLAPSIQETYEDEERAVFDPVAGAEFSAERDDAERMSGTGLQDTESTVQAGRMTLKQFFPSGTFFEAEVSSETEDTDAYDDPFSSVRLGLSVTQPLLGGFGADVNLAEVRQAELDTDISQYELRGFCESLIEEVENAYWDYALSLRQMEIVEESLNLAEQQLSETEDMIQVGAMAESELAALQAEVAVQEQERINARSTLETNRIRLLRLMNLPGSSPWNRELVLVHSLNLPEINLDAAETHAANALRMRPEVRQTELSIQQEDIEIIRTRNGLLPRMDLFITLGKTAYADSFAVSASDLSEDTYDAAAGISLEYPVFNRGTQAAHRRAKLRRDQAEKILDNLKQLIELDVRTAYIEVRRTKEQIAATTATRKFQEEKLRIETEKFRVGRSTNFLVSQAQRDLLGSRIDEVKAVIDYLKSLTCFYRLEGSLLERRGIKTPA